MSKVVVRKRYSSWQYTIELARVNGKRKRASKSGFRTKAEALAAGTAALADYNRTGISFVPSEQSVSDYFDYWLESYGKENLAETTIRGYAKRIRLYIKPEIGGYHLKDVTPETLQSLLNHLHGTKLSRNTLSSVRGILTSAFRYAAVKAKFIQVDPSVGLTLPNARADKRVGTHKKDREIVDEITWHKIIKRYPEGTTAHIPLMLAYHCGLRLGEAFAVTWDCIDFDSQTMLINKQIQNINKHWFFQLPKYDSVRRIDMGDIITDLLRRTYSEQELDRERCGEDYQQIMLNYEEDIGEITEADDLRPVHMINVRPGGLFVSPRIMMHASRVIHGKTSTTPVISEKFDFHSLRHTHAANLTAAEVPLPMIKERLGHADIDMTIHYADHVTEDMHDTLLKVIGGRQ